MEKGRQGQRNDSAEQMTESDLREGLRALWGDVPSRAGGHGQNLTARHSSLSHHDVASSQIRLQDSFKEQDEFWTITYMLSVIFHSL